MRGDPLNRRQELGLLHGALHPVADPATGDAVSSHVADSVVNPVDAVVERSRPAHPYGDRRLRPAVVTEIEDQFLQLSVGQAVFKSSLSGPLAVPSDERIDGLLARR